MEPFTLLHQDTTFQGHSKNPTHCKVSVYIWVHWCNSGARTDSTTLVYLEGDWMFCSPLGSYVPVHAMDGHGGKKVNLPNNLPQRHGEEVEVWLYSFFSLGARWRWVVNTTPRPLYPRESPGTHCTEGWVGPRADLDGCGKSLLHRDSIPGPYSTWRVAIPTTQAYGGVEIFFH